MPRFILRNEDGTVQLDLSTRITKILGQITTSGASGSITDARFVDGSSWYVATLNSSTHTDNGLNVSISGNTISWPAHSGFSYVIIYGIY